MNTSTLFFDFLVSTKLRFFISFPLNDIVLPDKSSQSYEA